MCRQLLNAQNRSANWLSLVFIVHLHDSTWLPGAREEFMLLKLDMALSEHVHNPLRGALNDSQAELPWQMAYVFTTNNTTTLALSPRYYYQAWLHVVEGVEDSDLDITCWVILWSSVCVYIGVNVYLCWLELWGWIPQICCNYGERELTQLGSNSQLAFTHIHLCKHNSVHFQ